MARYRLDPHLAVLFRPDGAAQIGWDPRRAVRVDPPAGLSTTALADVLADLRAGSTPARLRSHGGAPVDELLTELLDAGVVHEVPAPVTARTPVIRIHGPGPLAQLLTDGLRNSGARISRSAGPNVAANPAGTDLMLLADTQVVEPRLVRELVRAEVAHLPVRVRDGIGIVGPLVLPSSTSCLQCADLHRTDRDAVWPALAAQLRGRIGSAERPTLLATVAVALAQVQSVIAAVRWGGSGAPPPAPATLSRTLEIDVGRGSILARFWPRHPACGCGKTPEHSRSAYVAGA